MHESLRDYLVQTCHDFEGSYVEHNDIKYFLAETTGTDWPSQPAPWKIGQLPDDKWTGLDKIELYKF
tara:strand:+ start:251 stop:451 length:201 start_codon:yes stop_codon:yes gene_type:complete